MPHDPHPHGQIRAVTAPDGARLEYETVGQGPPLVLLHGFLTGRSAFARQRSILASRFRLILVSARGHDGSAAILPPDYGFDDSEIRDLTTILDAEGVSILSLLAHSSGGATGFAFARRFPDRVERIALIEPSLYGLLPAAAYQEIADRVRPVIEAAKHQGPEAALRMALAVIGGASWDTLDPHRQEGRLRLHAARAVFAGPHFQALLDLPATEADLVSLRPPALLIYGADSFSFEPFIAARFRAARPDIPIITLDNAGHNVHRDRHESVNPALIAFLAGLGSK